MKKLSNFEHFSQLVYTFQDPGLEYFESSDVVPLLRYLLLLPEAKLQEYLVDILIGFGYEPQFINNGSASYIYALGKQPFLMVGHTDTVLDTPKEVYIKTDVDLLYYVDYEPKTLILSGNTSLGADDRAGIAAILLFLQGSPLRPSLFFPSGEENGGLGTAAFIKDNLSIFKDKINFMIQFDRQGLTDVVQYSDDNPTLINLFTKDYFTKTFGSFTDISLLMPALGVSGVNLSIGYSGQHTASEVLDVQGFVKSVKETYLVISSMDFNIKHTYVPKPPVVFNTKPLTEKQYSYDPTSWSQSYTPSKSVSSFKADCDLCHGSVSETYYIDGMEVCNICFNEPSNGLKQNVYGTCSFCENMLLPDLHSIFGKIALIAFAGDNSVVVACPDCLEPLTDVNLDVKVSPTMTLREFIVAKMKGFINE